MRLRRALCKNEMNSLMKLWLAHHIKYAAVVPLRVKLTAANQKTADSNLTGCFHGAESNEILG